MNRSDRVLSTLRTTRLDKGRRTVVLPAIVVRSGGLIWSGLMVAAVCLPWLTSGSAAGLTFNLYDLAEWSSLHPLVRAESPALLTTLLLRLVFVAASLITATFPGRFSLLAALCLAATLLPPFDFFGANMSDPNYQQQFALFLLALTGSAGLHWVAHSHARFIRAFLALSGVVAAIFGLLQIQKHMQQFDLPFQPDTGWLLALGVFALLFFSTFLIADTDQHGPQPNETVQNELPRAVTS